MTPLLQARRLTKHFPGVTALRDVAFELRAGEIHAVCGENGAGKSTLIKLLAGIHPHGSYEGDLLVEGRAAAFGSVRDAETAGIAVITQELALVEELSVGENIFLGRLPRRGLRVDWLELHRRAAALLAAFDLALSPEAPVHTLGIGQKQLIEIIRATDKHSRVLVLDEPTAALPAHEVGILLDHLRRLRAQGTACIYISHKLDEVFALADRITVLRDGASVATLDRAAATIPDVIRLMVGREITDMYPRTHDTISLSRESVAESNHRPGDPPLHLGATRATPLLEVRGLEVRPARGEPARLRNLSFAVGSGEVLGFGGLMGAGRTELLMHLFGGWGVRAGGEVMLRGVPYADPTPRRSIERGLVLASEDRRRYGLVLEQSVGFNLSLSSLGQFTRRPGQMIDRRAEHARNQTFCTSLGIRAPGQDARVGGLSGGNQQKVVLGKALMTEPAVVLLDEPTRGIDVGAKLEVYELINRLTADGCAVVLVSSELPELMGMSDRIIMLAEGRIGGEFERHEYSQEKLLAAAMGRSGGK